MKRFKKMMAIVVVAVMTITMVSFGTLGAFAGQEPAVDPGEGGSGSGTTATTPAYDYPLTVTGLDEGDTVNFYQVVEWVGSAEGNVNGWKATSTFSSVLDKDTLTLILAGRDKATQADVDAGYAAALNVKIDPIGITSALAGKLSRCVTPSTTKAGTATANSEGKATLENASAGIYMALITPTDQDVVYNPVFVSADYNKEDGGTVAVSEDEEAYDDESAAKKSKLTLEKTFSNSSDYNTDNGATAAIGDILDFTVTTTIPGYGDTFDHPSFVLKDNMEKNLELMYGTVEGTNYTISVQDEDGSLDPSYYTLGNESAASGSTPGVDGYSVSFSETYLKSLAAPVTVTITYKAKVLADPQIANKNEEKNTVTLEFSHDPSTETSTKPGGDKEYKKDVTNHYTFSIDADNLFKETGLIGESGSEIIKIDVDKDGNPITSSRKVYSNITPTAYQASPLAGAEFELLDKDGNSFSPEKTATSDANGRIKFEGLDAGTYKLKETKAPAGYVADTQTYEIVITATIVNTDITEYYDQNGTWYDKPGTGRTPYTYTTNVLKKYTVTYNGSTVAEHSFMNTSHNPNVSWVKESSSEAPASFKNTKGLELPSTGGMGTTLFYLIGAILIIGAGVLLVTRRRVEGQE